MAARDFWKLTGVAIVFNVVVAVCAYWIFLFIHIGPLQLLFIWFPLYLAASLIFPMLPLEGPSIRPI